VSGDLLVRRIGRLAPVASEPVDGPCAVLVRDGVVEYAGPESGLPAGLAGGPALPELDAGGACVVPGFVDAHTHLVWAGSRREEFAARLAGERYDGGGILDTVAASRATSDDRLLELAADRATACLANGTTTIEVKTGYGLSHAEELRMLRVAGRLPGAVGLRVERTYLGAHAVPAGRDPDDYVDEVVATLPEAASAGARWCDVFCDEGVFTVEQARRVLAGARDTGLGLRIHAEELAPSGGAALAAELGCASADHLEHVTPQAAAALAAAGVVGVLLPSVALSLRSGAWGHARVLQEAGVELALATDCNPGTSWCESMPYVMQLACLQMGLSVEQALRAATLGAARSLRLDQAGWLGPGSYGDLAVLDAAHEIDLVAHLGSHWTRATVVGGAVLHEF
jgi:imidazolonepropionase